MSSRALESINNAIVRMQQRVMGDPSVPDGNKRAVDDLARHWQRWVWGKLRRTLAPWSLSALAEGYIVWYTRAYYMLSPAVREPLVKPQDIDASYAQFADDEVRRLENAGQDVGRYTQEAAREAAPVLRVIASGAGMVLSATGKIVLIVGGTLVAILLAWGFAKGGRR